jgi:hypothetical protein
MEDSAPETVRTAQPIANRQIIYNPQLVKEGGGLKGSGDTFTGNQMWLQASDVFSQKMDLP